MNKELLRKLPKIDELLKEPLIQKEIDITYRVLVVESLREAIEKFRRNILENKINDFESEDVLNYAIGILTRKKQHNLRKVINATGTVIHTNLGRSLLSSDAVKNAMEVASRYNNLEYDIKEGKRGSRYSHIEELIIKITGAEAAIVVNNNAAAIMLVLDTLSKNKEVIVSRGQLVEIGGSFRIPEVMKFSGAKLIEVGTTNRTHLYDYEDNINENTGILLKVHTSNFKIYGFTEEVELDELVKLGQTKEIPVVEDIGSGVLVDFTKYGFTHEPTVQDSIKKGVDIVTFSGDKMLGGPQAGIIVGKKKYIQAMKKNQLTRALRIDKMTLAGLEGTLRHYLDEKNAIKNIPTLNMILASKDEMKKKAIKFRKKLKNSVYNFKFDIGEDYSMVGGGSMPTEKIPTHVIKVRNESISAAEIEKNLRLNEVPIIGRVFDDEFIIDVRTVFEEDITEIIKALKYMES
ncbi:L-seryl-tRNA(Sec) selenium transferase [Clostridium senegalense]|uniref:L-seryl-tRNA(Sec) selenium transferase n=1 Tax=Clostridium senegalense TaxID=1465809 RepID=A0A6M0GYX9_9CLOT|nr:L-seryl-tRNA(Sec) selenium transferase [Clostridium senegalense]NEU03397.1 L-seryl-tRNA(Sec) selenium transferase [Clostridium senegalense]